jgi:hypothetical protein
MVYYLRSVKHEANGMRRLTSARRVGHEGVTRALARLTLLDLSFRENHIPKTGVRQIFVRDSTDILLELNFSEG